MLEPLIDAVKPFTEPHLIRVSGLITVLVLLTLPFELWIRPLASSFRLDNPYINFPMVPEHVPTLLLGFLSVLMPFGFIAATGVVDKRFRRHALVSILGLLMGIACTIFVIDVLKILIGNQRPDFIARCQPRSDAPLHESVTVYDVCTNQNLAVLWEGCKSTPSGHSALSFAGLGFLSFWLISSFELHHTKSPIWVKMAGIMPFFLAAYVAFTRIIDHKHHWIDVILGSLIGTAFAYFSHTYVVRDSKPDIGHTMATP